MIIPLSKPKHTVKEILDRFFDPYLHSKTRKLKLEDHHLKAVHHIRSCHTARLGIYYFKCEGCDKEHTLPRSCKHRFCSRCGASDTNAWAEKMFSKLLDVSHHHVVFSLPKGLRYLSKLNGDLLHDLLFEVSREVLKSWFKSKHGLNCGLVSVLHTNGSRLNYHPHVHIILTRGGLDENRVYKELPGYYLCKADFLGEQFKIKYIRGLLKLYDKGELKVSNRTSSRSGLESKLRRLSGEKNWIVNVERAQVGVKKLIDYVGRYTKRSCVSERKIESVSDTHISLRYKDYKNSNRGEKPKENIRRFEIEEFLDELLQHVPSPGYKVVRYGGIYATSELGKLPEEYKYVEEEEDKEEMEFDPEGFEFLQYRRKVHARTGKDPLYCYDCCQDLVLYKILIEKKGVVYEEYIDSG